MTEVAANLDEVYHLARSFGEYCIDMESLPEPEDTVGRLKTHILLLAAKICYSRDTVHSPPYVISGDGFAEHMACVLSERWSLIAEDYIGSIYERRYALIITEDEFLHQWTVKVRPREFGGDEFEDYEELGPDGEGKGRTLTEALSSLVAVLQEQVDAKAQAK